MHGPADHRPDAVALRARTDIGMAEFIALCAALCAVAAMSIDILLPALPAIGAAFDIADENRRQLVIIVFAVTFSGMQLFYGPISDRFGRKPLMIIGLFLYLLGSGLALVVPGFSWLLGMRFVQGAGAAALSVVTMAMIRDCFSGQAMGRVLTFVFTTFMIMPIVAPVIGQSIAVATGWRGIFAFNAIMGVMLMAWLIFRLRETLDVADRRPLSLGSLASAFVEIVSHRITAGYAIASTLSMISLFAYIVSVQQVYGELYGLGGLFPLAFAASSIGIAGAALFSARMVRLFGMRPVAHAMLLVYTLSGLLLVALSLAGNPPFAVTFALLSICMMAFGIFQGNMNAIALEPLGHIAGSASSLFGVVTSTTGAIFGGMIGQAYDGTVVPLAFAFGAGGLIATVVILWTERGRLFGR